MTEAAAGAVTDAASGAPTDAADGGSSDPVLRTSDLTKQFGQMTAVDGLDLAVEEGEFRSLIGPNGAGKTTTFDMITGALAPTEGTVEFRGAEVTGLPPHERARRGMGRSFQLTNVFPGLTVRENVRLAAQAVNREDISRWDAMFRDKESFETIADRTDAVLDRVGLSDRAGAHAETLAYGDQRRLEIGIVLADDPSVVLLDEPTAGMSGEESRETIDLIEDVLADQSLLLIEHDIDLVMEVSDRITVLTRGEELATGTPAEIAADEAVREAYLGGVRQ
jgi:branched-chain amino acid transport system ATP-binding protein